jgi:GNAT superfamily N-acetyltransferase
VEHVSFQVESLSDLLGGEIEPLWQRHWEELALDREVVPLDPDYQRYRELDAQGALSTVTMRQNGRLVGYSIMLVAAGLHYKSTLEAQMDIFWIMPEARGRFGGVRLFKAVERELRRRGVKRIYAGSKLHNDSSRLFVALGYTPIEAWFSKMLIPED